MLLTSFHRAIRYRKEFSFSAILLLSLQFLHYGLVFSHNDYLLCESLKVPDNLKVKALEHNFDDEYILIENIVLPNKAEQNCNYFNYFISPNNSQNYVNQNCWKYFPDYLFSSVSVVSEYSIPRSPPLFVS